MKRVLSLCLAFLCATGCGEGADGDLDAPAFIDLGDDVVADERESRGIFPYGVMPPELAEPGSVDKSFTATDGASLFPRFVAVFGQFGIRGTARCQSDPSIWDQNCNVPQRRFDRVFIDLASCSQAAQVLRDTMVNAYLDLEATLRTQIGWDIARTFDAGVATTTLKCDGTLGSGGQATRPVDFSWNMPGFPHDVGFFKKQGGLARIGLVAIQGAHGTGPSGQRATFNVARHELLHTLGWGHFPGVNDMMNTVQPTDVITELSSSQIEMMRNFLFASHTGAARYCNWLPGDPLGDICPHNVAP